MATVFGDKPRRVAIMEFGIAAASRSRISRSRAVSSGNGSAAGAGVAKEAQHPLRDFRSEDRLARGNGPDRPADLLLFSALDHIAASTGPHSREHRVVIVKHREHQNRDLWCNPGDLPRGREAILTRHLQVEHRHIRAVQHDLPHCLATVSGNAYHVDARQRPKQRGQGCRPSDSPGLLRRCCVIRSRTPP